RRAAPAHHGAALEHGGGRGWAARPLRGATARVGHGGTDRTPCSPPWCLHDTPPDLGQPVPDDPRVREVARCSAADDCPTQRLVDRAARGGESAWASRGCP